MEVKFLFTRDVKKIYRFKAKNSRRRTWWGFVFQKVKLRSQQTSFDWKSNCFLCGRDAIVDTRHPDRNDVQIVATILSTTVDISTKKRTTLREKILNICTRKLGFWTSQVESQLQNCIDLVAEEAVYSCSTFPLVVTQEQLMFYFCQSLI